MSICSGVLVAHSWLPTLTVSRVPSLAGPIVSEAAPPRINSYESRGGLLGTLACRVQYRVRRNGQIRCRR